MDYLINNPYLYLIGFFVMLMFLNSRDGNE